MKLYRIIASALLVVAVIIAYAVSSDSGSSAAPSVADAPTQSYKLD